MATILIIDDESGIRYIAKQVLSQNCSGRTALIEAATGQEGLRLLGEYRPELVLLDYRLPDMDGNEWLTRAQAICRTAVLLISASSEIEKIAHNQDMVIGSLAKPFKLSKLTFMVCDALSRALPGEVSP